MIRLFSTLALLVGGGALFMSVYVHPVSASGEYQSTGHVIPPGFHLNWFWKAPVRNIGSTFGAVNANAASQHKLSVPNVLLRRPVGADPHETRATEFQSIISGPRAVIPGSAALTTLKAAAIEAEAVALEQEQNLEERARRHLNDQLNLQAQQEITYAAKLREFQDKLLKIEQDAELATSVRAAEADALSARTKADIENGRQRLQALRDELIGDVLKQEGSQTFLRMELIRRLGESARNGRPLPTRQGIDEIQDIITSLEKIGQPAKSISTKRKKRSAGNKR